MESLPPEIHVALRFVHAERNRLLIFGGIVGISLYIKIRKECAEKVFFAKKYRSRVGNTT